jgi:hypothetical protein
MRIRSLPKEAATEAGGRDAAIARMGEVFGWLRGLADGRYRDDREIGVGAAAGAFNAVLKWGNLAEAATDAGRRDAAIARMGEVFGWLRDLADGRYRDDREIGVLAARGAFNAVMMMGNLAEAATDAGRRDAAIARMEEVFGWLRNLADGPYRDDREIVVEAAKGAFTAVLKWNKLAEAATDAGGRDAAIARMGEVFGWLRGLADGRYRDDRDIVVYAARGAFNAVKMMGNLAEAATDAGRRDAVIARMEEVFGWLRDLADGRYRDDSGIGVWAAKGAVASVALKWGNLAEVATDAGRRDAAIARMEEVFGWLRDLADGRYRDDREIGVLAAMGAFNAALKWSKLGNFVHHGVCRDYLRELRDRHHNPEINYLASQMNV